MTSRFEQVVEKDIEILWLIHDICHERPIFDMIMTNIVSKHPWNDIVVIIWAIFIYGIIEIGVLHFWIVTFNLVLCFALNRLIKAKRPVEFDIDLQPIADVQAESYGFPSIESHMSVVIIGHLIYHFKIYLFIPVGLLLIFIIGFSRLYAKSRFPHQIIGSWILGCIGLPFGIRLHSYLAIHK